MPTYQEVHERIRTRPRTWLVTGVAGFIGSNLLESLLKLNQQLVGLDNLSTSSRRNLAQVKDAVSENQWRKFRFVEGDIRSLDTCRDVCGSAEIGKATRLLGYRPLWRLSQGLARAIDWYVAMLAPQRSTDVWAAESRVVLHES